MTASQIFQSIRRKSWAAREAVLLNRGSDFKFLSTHSINNLLEKPKDWNEIAKKCSENPRHEMFGKKVDDILADWQSRGKKGQDRGISLDNYIQAKLSHKAFDESALDEKELTKCRQFDITYEKFFKDWPLVGQEIWLNSKLGLNVRLDALFLRPNVNNEVKLLIVDWKNNEIISVEDRWNKLQGPAAHLEQCDIVKMTIQIQIYRYILEEYEIAVDVIERLFQYTSLNYYIHKPAFEYDKQFIEDIVSYCLNKREENETTKE